MILLFKLLRKTSKGNWLKPLMFASIATLSFYILQGQPQNLSDNQFNMIFAFIALYSGVLLSLYNHISSWLNNFSLEYMTKDAIISRLDFIETSLSHILLNVVLSMYMIPLAFLARDYSTVKKTVLPDYIWNIFIEKVSPNVPFLMVFMGAFVFAQTFRIFAEMNLSTTSMAKERRRQSTDYTDRRDRISMEKNNNLPTINFPERLEKK